MNNLSAQFRGLLLGTAVGDALGLPAEGLRPDIIRKLGWSCWQHRLFLGKGMVSDDTEHTFMVCQALLAYPEDSKYFTSSLAWKFRWWLIAIPAGIGYGTLRAILRLWLFLPFRKCGVFSAGNGPAMRSAIIGARFWNDKDCISEYVRCSTELTHKDPRALTGALAVSHAAALGMRHSSTQKPDAKPFWGILRNLSLKDDTEWPSLVDRMEGALEKNLSVADFVSRMNLSKGVTGYIYHTVPVAIYTWLRHYGDFRTSLTEALNCGGDTDTVGAIVGALAGITVGEDGIPREWLENIWEWPRSISVLRKAADHLARSTNGNPGPVPYFWPGIIPRNLFLIVIVIGHVFLRLLPAALRRYTKI